MDKQISCDEIRSMLDWAGQKMGLACHHVPIEISSRMKRTYGSFVFRLEQGKLVPVAFRFALKLVSGDYSEEIVRQTVLHEYAHFYVNMLDQKNHGHNGVFRNACQILGIPDHTHFQGNHQEEKKRGYRILCSRCQKEVARRRRRDAAKNLMRTHRSGCCQAKLSVRMDIF